MYDMTNDEIVEAAARLTPQWLAGFFDGEGWVSALKSSGAHGSVYRVQVGIGQADAKIIALIALKFGSGVAQNMSMRTKFFHTRWNGLNALSFLEYIKDHVVCKKRQVLAAIELIRAGRLNGGGGGLTPAEIQKRAEFAAVIRNSNHEHHNAAIRQEE